MARVVVGMSGGVDSSVAAYLLKKQGYDVLGLFMRNWHETADDGNCSAEQDFADVRRVCKTLDIPYYTIDFSKEYFDRVFRVFLDEYGKGRTPNPDVLCNKEIKFDSFLRYALSLEADYIATGHYADVMRKDGKTYLLRADDENKDQTYFLNQLKSEQLEKVIFPLAHIEKPEVRRIAAELGLATAEKKDSTGICFIGERNFRRFLSEYLPMKDGDMIDVDTGRAVGRHTGVFYYTVGQRKGLGIGGGGNGQPWFVVKKDVANNVLYVKQGDDDCLYRSGVYLPEFNFITDVLPDGEYKCLSRIRHRQPLVDSVMTVASGVVNLRFLTPVRGVACGQYAVAYFDKVCVGGGVIEDAFPVESAK